ncbi:helix-turn-helix transcriptional regulator [Mucilaginibacter flavidus]|uniref:helix-turn-helix transcriptional regulator n=1 Tax=Mucilaginibacter flavidus TaxID=2949309 RepID=UPI002093A5CB|nr:helix-turn-helix transcriptional regulator [Mucilaginibacter flavidus]MCO5945637.1 helix-turn-helix transcriptional regulator [Mucilaginibacter flavidus]
MTVTTYFPTDALKPFIKHYLVIESDREVINRLVPDTSVVLVFRYKGNVNYAAGGIETNIPASVLTGLKKTSRLVNYSAGSAAILVIFKTAAAGSFFKVPLHKLFEDSLPLDNFISSPQASEIEERLSAAKNNVARIILIEQFLFSQYKGAGGDQLVLAAIEKMYAAKGFYKIKNLADSLYISQDAFEKRFRKSAGASPKQFSSIIRMRTIIANGKKHEKFNQLAYNAGYFDQSHFNNDFKLFTGQTPSDFFKSSSFW